MKITIDTKEDSHSEIKKVISMLSALVGGEETTYSNKDIFSDSSPEVTPTSDSSKTPSPESSGGVFGNLFSNDKTGETAVEEKKEDEKPEEKKEESDENVEIIPY